eukprot:TRINITY_DN10297_c0_g1_i1.p1 TRINITY_DN10297_c0_g1~~TRINITY_DN10297_c0_g1_i1.p1  ORF type:complete len:1316 (+),score=257.39 TRINITY_DN10297_c0_g1_i1:364-3948(+)
MDEVCTVEPLPRDVTMRPPPPSSAEAAEGKSREVAHQPQQLCHGDDDRVNDVVADAEAAAEASQASWDAAAAASPPRCTRTNLVEISAWLEAPVSVAVLDKAADLEKTDAVKAKAVFSSASSEVVDHDSGSGIAVSSHLVCQMGKADEAHDGKDEICSPLDEVCILESLPSDEASSASPLPSAPLGGERDPRDMTHQPQHLCGGGYDQVIDAVTHADAGAEASQSSRDVASAACPASRAGTMHVEISAWLESTPPMAVLDGATVLAKTETVDAEVALASVFLEAVEPSVCQTGETDEVSRATKRPLASAVLDEGVAFDSSRVASIAETASVCFAIRRSIYAYFAVMDQLDLKEIAVEQESCLPSQDTSTMPVTRRRRRRSAMAEDIYDLFEEEKSAPSRDMSACAARGSQSTAVRPAPIVAAVLKPSQLRTHNTYRPKTSATLEAVNMTSPRLRAVVEAFRSCDTSGANCVSAGDLALYWAASAEHKKGRAVNQEERGLIAADVQLFFAQADVFRTGHVDFDEWLHHFLLEVHPPGPAASLAISQRLWLIDDKDAIPRAVRIWLKADVKGDGCTTVGRILNALIDDGDVQEANFVSSIFGKDSDRRISYADWVAQQIGLEASPVELLYYDLSHSLAKYLTPVFLWRLEEGVWHTGLTVFGQEYYYWGRINADEPGKTPFGKPTKSLLLGHTFFRQDEFHEFMDRNLKPKFRYSTYDIFTNNCNHLCDALAQFLLGRHIPDQVRFLPNRLLGTPVARLLKPVLNQWLRGRKNEAEESSSEEDEFAFTCIERQFLESDTKTSVARGGMVLFEEATGFWEPVVANVVDTHRDGTSDLSWLDSSGRLHVSRGVPAWQIRPYEIALDVLFSGDSNVGGNISGNFSCSKQRSARRIYLEAATALGASGSLRRMSCHPEAERHQTAALSSGGREISSAQRCSSTPPQRLDRRSSDYVVSSRLGNVVGLIAADEVPKVTDAVASPQTFDAVDDGATGDAEVVPTRPEGATATDLTICVQGHQWRPAKLSFWQGRLQGHRCVECGRGIPRGERRVCCTRCKISVCERCWGAGDTVMRFAAAAFDGGARSSAAPRCGRGHLMERLAGQELRTAAACRRCRKKELGATSAFFFSCRPCRYDLCIQCVERPSRSIRDSFGRSHSQPLLETRRAANQKKTRRRRTRLVAKMTAVQNRRRGRIQRTRI